MDEIIVTSQAELDSVPVDYNGRVIIKFGTPYSRAVVNRRFKYSVEARENSSVVARENSSVEARENSSVEARENSSVVAWENSSVVAWENSSVVAKANVQVVDNSRKHDIKVSGNARIVYNPETMQEYIAFHDIESDGKTAKLFKAVHKRDGKYSADHKHFEYVIGEEAQADSLDTDPTEDCGHGIHMAHKAWCLDYGSAWKDLAILEVECEIDKVVVPLGGSGKVRTGAVKVLREVPLSECGLYGEMLAKRRERDG